MSLSNKLPPELKPDTIGKETILSDVFISYSRRDREFVKLLYQAIEDSGRQAWIDWEGIPISTEWMKEIYRGIDLADNFIFVISPSSAASDTCRLEVAHAVERRKRILPIMAQPVEPDELPPDLARIQYISFGEQEKFGLSFQELAAALETDFDWVREHTKLLHQALEWSDNKSNPSYLLRGEGLRKAENWLRNAAEKEPGSSPLQEQFIDASRQNEKRRRTRLIGAVLAALVIIAGISKYAYDRYQDARTERALKLTSQAGLNLYRYPGEALATASRAKTINPELSEAEQVRQTALRIIGQRIELAERDRNNWSSGSTFIPLSGPFFRGDLTARISGDGRYVLLATERGETGNKPPGEGYLFDNESLRVSKLEPVDRKDRIKRRLDYLGFGSSEKKIYLARQYNVEIYGLDGRFEKEFYVSSTKYPITFVDAINDDRLLVIGDSTGPVWIVDAQTEKTVHHLFGYNSQNPLVSLTPSPSGKIAIMGLRNGELHLWNTAEDSGSSLQKIPHTGKVFAVLFKPDPGEETWITGGEDGKVRLWTLRANKIELVSLFDHQGERVGYAAFIREPPGLLTITFTRTARIWNLETGTVQIASSQ